MGFSNEMAVDVTRIDEIVDKLGLSCNSFLVVFVGEVAFEGSVYHCDALPSRPRSVVR